MRVLVGICAVVVVVGLIFRYGDAQQVQERSPLGLQADHAGKTVVRASEIIGMNVKNHADEDVGEINDLAIDSTSGSIEYAAVSVGGVAGIGDKLFAVPWSAFECRPETGTEPDDRDPELVAVLNVRKETFMNAQGFNQDNWPDMANETWRMENDRHFQSRSARETRSNEQTQ